MTVSRTEFPGLTALAVPSPRDRRREPEPHPRRAPPSLAELRARRSEILERVAPYGASEVRVFGSVARGTQGPNSDLDVLVDLDPASHGLFDLAGIGAALESLFDCGVDVVAPRLLAAPLPEQLVREAVRL